MFNLNIDILSFSDKDRNIQQFLLMRTNKKFLPAHPKIVKKIPATSIASSMSFRSSQNDMKDLNTSILAEEHQQTIQSIIKKQENIVQQLEESLKILISQNCVLEDSVKYYDNEKQLQDIRKKIQQSKLEQQELIKKIENCQKVQQTTTPEQYYLWQKKKKTEEFNRKIQEAFHDNHEEKNSLLETCTQYEEEIKEQKNQMLILLDELDKIKNGESDSDKFTQVAEVDQEQFERLKQDYKTLSSSIQFIKESNQILISQLQQRVQPIKKHLRASFTNFKSGLMKDLQTTKRQIQDGDPQPPGVQQKQFKYLEIIEEYEKKMNQLKFQVPPEQLEEVQEIIDPMDWKAFKWQHLTVPSQTLKQTQGAFSSYQITLKEYQEYGVRLDTLQQAILKTVTDTMQFKQRGMELQEMINKILRLSMSMSR